MEIKLIEPFGYCAGVTNAINIALKARLDYPNKKIIVFGMLVHNQIVVNLLNEKGIETYYRKDIKDIDLLNSIPENSVLIFSAHGHDYKLDEIAYKKNLIVLDTTCPKVKHNLDIIKQEIEKGHEVIYIGNKNHPEALAALAISPKVFFYDTKFGMETRLVSDKSPLLINQTTLNILALEDIYNKIKEIYPNARISNEICNTTRLRQEATKNLGSEVDLIIVIGDNESSNTRRLFEIATSSHPNTLCLLISNANELNPSVLNNKKCVALVSGASTPKLVIDEIIALIKKY